MHCWGWGIGRCEARVGAPRTRRLPPPQTSLCIDQHVTSVLISLQKAKVKCNRAAHRPRTWGGRCSERSAGPGAGCRQGSGGASASRRRCLPPLLSSHPIPGRLPRAGAELPAPRPPPAPSGGRGGRSAPGPGGGGAAAPRGSGWQEAGGRPRGPGRWRAGPGLPAAAPGLGGVQPGY